MIQKNSKRIKTEWFPNRMLEKSFENTNQDFASFANLNLSDRDDCKKNWCIYSLVNEEITGVCDTSHNCTCNSISHTLIGQKKLHVQILLGVCDKTVYTVFYMLFYILDF